MGLGYLLYVLLYNCLFEVFVLVAWIDVSLSFGDFPVTDHSDI